MLWFPRLLILLINIDQETVLNWFGIKNSDNSNSYFQIGESDSNVQLSDSVLENSKALSLDTLNLILNGLWEKVHDGLTLTDMENILFFLLFIRFVIVAIRYNVKTSFIITFIGMCAGYMWYRHFIDLIDDYRIMLVKLPFLNKLGVDAIKLHSMVSSATSAEIRREENVNWYNPIKLIYYAFSKAIVVQDSTTKDPYYIDPLSMLVANIATKFNLPPESKIVHWYYQLYHVAIPTAYKEVAKTVDQMSGLVSYVLITRMGKRFCPYLIRWHWTFILILKLFEHTAIFLIFRIWYFEVFTLIPASQNYKMYVDSNLMFQINLAEILTAGIVILHLSFVLFGMLHAFCGQYFYIPILTESAEMHIGPRPKNSIYSGGNTAWQEPEEMPAGKYKFTKLWYGWFGSGTTKSWPVVNVFKTFIRNLLKKLKRKFRK